MMGVAQHGDLSLTGEAMQLCIPNYLKTPTREPLDRKWNGTDPLLIVIMLSD